jgi:single-strand DNA-binding protein
MTATLTSEANLVGDPDLRFTKLNAQAVCTCRLAVSTRRKNMDGEYFDTPPVFYEATVWGALAEHVAESLHKGDRVLVHGTSYDEEWTDREGGTRVKHVLQVTAIGASLRYATVTVHRATTKPQTEQPAEPAPAG